MGWVLVGVWDGATLLVGVRAWFAVDGSSLSEYQGALLLGWVASAILVSILGFRLIRLSAPGGRSVRLDPAGIEIRYPDGSSSYAAFADTKLSLELRDFSDHPELTARIPLYSIVADRRETELTEEAYRSLYNQLSERGLITRSARARSWLIPASIQPMIHYASGRDGAK